MHPAASVIFFTVSSGAGYGLLATLALLAAFGLIAPGLGLGLAGFGLALALVTAGLLSSTFHLGHPERAWRALTQWRSSWLSREGVAAVVTYVPAGLLALLFTFFTPGPGARLVLGLATAAMAVLTVYSTGMIYRVLKPVHQWHNAWVVPGYLVLGAATGLLAAHALLRAFAPEGSAPAIVGIAALAAVAAGFLLKRGYWAFIDATPAASTAETATGLGAFGRVRLLEAPHTGTNFLMQEMGYRVARKHAARLRLIAQLAAFLLPAAFTLAALLLGGVAASLLAIVAAALGILGVAVERWLFFAEAKHTVSLYYGAERA
ncbi:MAG: dimethyl sulfoxide reductase anchor subunit [Alphaproteobacteria bacterium]|nr:dimethyl sulfoxide reductase anchor subunit [Alphaproteobacteria bacterium]